jgi:hypothetical protein
MLTADGFPAELCDAENQVRRHGLIGPSRKTIKSMTHRQQLDMVSSEPEWLQEAHGGVELVVGLDERLEDGDVRVEHQREVTPPRRPEAVVGHEGSFVGLVGRGRAPWPGPFGSFYRKTCLTASMRAGVPASDSTNGPRLLNFFVGGLRANEQR